MNNKEMLEDYIEALRKPKPFKYTNEQKAQAIENLIKENEELKERNKKLEYAMYNDLGNIINLGILLSENAEKPKDVNIYVDECQAFLNTLNYYYIPKSKIKEKIETLEKLQNEFKNNEELRIKIIAYKELLEGE